MRIRPGFTIVELLVVVAIISMLVALLLPAVLAGREAARRTHCGNKFRQVSLATLHYAAFHSELLPTPVARLHGPSQVAGWRYDILPMMEHDALHDSLATAPWKATPRFDRVSTVEVTKRVVVSDFQCPSSPTVVSPWPLRIERFDGTVVLDDVSASDIAAVPLVKAMSGETLLATAWAPGGRSTFKLATELPRTRYTRRRPKLSTITDGLSNTILTVERAGLPWVYTCRDAPPLPSLFGPWMASDVERVEDSTWTACPVGINLDNYFGLFSFHGTGVNVSFCDGSVRYLDENLEAANLVALLSRSAGD